MNRLDVCFMVFWTLGGCARETRKVEILPPPKSNSGNASPDLNSRDGAAAAPAGTQSSQNSKANGAEGSKEESQQPSGSKEDGSSSETGPKPPNSTVQTGSEFSGKYQLFYSFPSQNRKDCLANRGGTQIGIVPCSYSNPDVGFEIKSVGTQGYHIKVMATGKCMAINLKSNYEDPAADSLIQGPCEQNETQNPFFSLEPTKELTKLTIQGLCVKIGSKGNLYLADCNTSWTWFSKSAM